MGKEESLGMAAILLVVTVGIAAASRGRIRSSPPTPTHPIPRRVVRRGMRR